jgi:hypothetical protein
MENVNAINMTNQEKAVIYDNCTRESDRLQREISKLKSQYATNIPPHIQKEINEKETRISVLVGRLESLFK